jgi:hypothetical protein
MSLRRSGAVRPLAFAGTLAVALALLAGCGKKGTLSPNRSPETVVFVSGDLDTVRHIVDLSWFGTDPDGEVVVFEYKWIYEAGQEPAAYDSNAWFTTTRTESTFAVWTPNGTSMPTFVVRAIDDEGVADPTPARQTFRFRNLPPQVELTGTPVLPATTFPVATIVWTSSDPDGDIADAHYLLWLDDNAADPIVVPASNQYTIPPAAFSDGAGGYVVGPHTIHIRAVDDGGAASPPDSFTWNVVAPVGQVLLVDDCPSTESSRIDQAYANALDRQLGGPSQYSVIRIETGNPFRSPADVTATFGFFRSVLWYQETSVARSGALPIAEPGIRTLLAAGGNLFLCSTIAVGTSGTLAGDAFLNEIVGADSLRVNRKTLNTNFDLESGSVLTAGAAMPYDSLAARAIAKDLDALALRVPAEAAFLARPILLDSTQTEDWIVGVDRIPAGGAGRFVFLTFPLRLLGGTPPGAPAPAPDADYQERTIRKVLARFGHGTPP